MALRVIVQHSRRISLLSGIYKPTYLAALIDKKSIGAKTWYHDGDKRHHSHDSQEPSNFNFLWSVGAALGMTALALKMSNSTQPILAEDEDDQDHQEVIDKENRWVII